MLSFIGLATDAQQPCVKRHHLRPDLANFMIRIVCKSSVGPGLVRLRYTRIEESVCPSECS